MGWVRRIVRAGACVVGAVCLMASLANGARAEETLKADHILILKSERRLVLMRGGEALKSYVIALGKNPVGPKVRQGDARTPEGTYKIDWRNPASKFHRALHISYPNAADVARAREIGAPTGGDIMIHGLPAKLGRVDPVDYFPDWTEGCVAVGSLAIEEIWSLVDDGISVEIRP
jgi:murein L,D-transpeptidase YafK